MLFDAICLHVQQNILLNFASFILTFLQNKSGKAATEDDADLSNEEYIVEKILAKRFNPKKRCSEYLIKWEGYSQWVPPSINRLCFLFSRIVTMYVLKYPKFLAKTIRGNLQKLQQLAKIYWMNSSGISLSKRNLKQRNNRLIRESSDVRVCRRKNQ